MEIVISYFKNFRPLYTHIDTHIFKVGTRDLVERISFYSLLTYTSTRGGQGKDRGGNSFLKGGLEREKEKEQTCKTLSIFYVHVYDSY